MAKKPDDNLPKYVGWYMPTSRATDYDGTIVDPVTGQVSTPPSMTKQSFRDECDINNILRQYKATGIISHINSRAAQGTYEDMPDVVDFQLSLEIIRQASIAFESLPSRVRDRFGNDPSQFLAFLQDPANAEEAGKLGLLKPVPVEPAPTKVEVVNPPPTDKGEKTA